MTALEHKMNIIGKHFLGYKFGVSGQAGFGNDLTLSDIAVRSCLSGVLMGLGSVWRFGKQPI